MTQEERLLSAQTTRINEDWLRALDAYHVQFLVLNLHTESDMVAYFRSRPGWLVDFEDTESIIFTQAVAQTYAYQKVLC